MRPADYRCDPAENESRRAGTGREDDVPEYQGTLYPVSYTHLRAHETVLDLVCRLLLEKKNM